MTDLIRVLPDFPVQKYSNLIAAVESRGLTTTDLITLDPAEIGKRTHLPLLDIKRLCTAVLGSLHADLGVSSNPSSTKQPHNRLRLKSTFTTPFPTSKISTLDPQIDSALSGGIPTSQVTEVTGESGAGKTQLLLTLLLSVQLPPSHGGLSRNALYISTEAALSTRRLSQILNSNPYLSSLAPEIRPSLDGIISTCTPDLESQEHILTFQVPVEIARRNIGLVVVDSIAANYRAEFDHRSGSNMGARSADLVKLGMHLRDLAQKHDLAVVVSNQVADRFGDSSSFFSTSSRQQQQQQQQWNKTPASSLRGPLLSPHNHNDGHPHRQSYQDSPLLSRSRPVQQALASSQDAEPRSSLPSYVPPPEHAEPDGSHHPALALDHQQRWFTGWGDDPYAQDHPLKTPSLGLVWSTQISGRMALLRRPVQRSGVSGWRRWIKVVWGFDAPSTGTGSEERGGVEFEVWTGGLRGVGPKDKGRGQKKAKEEA